MRARWKRLGQNFLTCREVAVAESEFGRGREAVEIGPGKGILTHELCKRAAHVTAVEIDSSLYNAYGEREPNLALVNADFFKLDPKNIRGNILISNIPYSMSSSTITWLIGNRMEALLCLQKEFAEHMLAEAGSGNYSKLSVLVSLSFSAERVRSVPASCFRPRPKVDSVVIHLAPKENNVWDEDIRTISLLMGHKKKRLRNAITDARAGLGISKVRAREISARIGNSGVRVFTLAPERLLSIAKELNALV